MLVIEKFWQLTKLNLSDVQKNLKSVYVTWLHITAEKPKTFI